MLVKVIQSSVPYVGARGTVKELPERAAKLLILLGKVEAVEAPPNQAYERRDMQAKPLERSEVDEPAKPRRKRRTAALAVE